VQSVEKTAAVFTFGCRLNTADTGLMMDRLVTAGYRVIELTDGCDAPDLVILNSCAVTAEAEHKCRRMARRLRARFPQARIVITGCAATPPGGEHLAAEGIADAVLPNPRKRDLAALLGTGSGTLESGPVFHEQACGRFPFRSRAFLKIQEGCSNFCTYCIVPYVRGPERSRAFEEVLADCEQALAGGFAELVLTGVNTTTYCDRGRRLPDLLAAIAAMPGDFRIRLSSTEPEMSNRELIDVMRENPRICRFLHLSLQHGCDRVLKRMNRHYTAAEYADFALAAKAAISGLSLGTDVIVGFPGETDEDFDTSRAFIREIGFANTHLFTYSPRPGTPAASFPDRVPAAVAKVRYEKLAGDAAAARRQFLERCYGTDLPVIFEEVRPDGTQTGWSDNYVAVRVPVGMFPLGKIVKVPFSAAYEGGH